MRTVSLKFKKDKVVWGIIHGTFLHRVCYYLKYKLIYKSVGCYLRILNDENKSLEFSIRIKN